MSHRVMGRRDNALDLVGVTIIAVQPIEQTIDPWPGSGGLVLHLSDGRKFKLEGDPEIGSRYVWGWWMQDENHVQG